MIIVPIKGDTILDEQDKLYKVISYTNLDTKGPCVYCELVESYDKSEAVKVYFKDIMRINDVAVHLKKSKTKNVFSADEYIERKFDLPDVGTTITIDDYVRGEYDVVIKRVLLHKSEYLSSGLILECIEPDSEEEVQITLDKITDIAKTMFNRASFEKYYADYFPTIKD